MHNLPSLALQSCENNSNLTFGGSLAGTTSVLSVKSSIILLCRSTLSVQVLHDLLVIVSASSLAFYFSVIENMLNMFRSFILVPHLSWCTCSCGKGLEYFLILYIPKTHKYLYRSVQIFFFFFFLYIYYTNWCYFLYFWLNHKQ